MVGPFGSPDDVSAAKMSVSVLASIVIAVFSTSIPHAAFERRFNRFLNVGGDETLTFKIAQGAWVFAMLWLSIGGWWLFSRVENVTFEYRVAYYATLLGTIVANIIWPVLYFVDMGAEKQRYGLSIVVMIIGWLSAIAALVIGSVTTWTNWAVITNRVSAIIALIGIFFHVFLFMAIFVYFYTLKQQLYNFWDRLGKRFRGSRTK